MINGTTAAMLLLLQLTATCGHAHQMCKVKHDSKGGNDIQLIRHFLNVNVPKKNKDCS